jgi:dipeptidyl aminopeptidase/acylaminoacyl peptidase
MKRLLFLPIALALLTTACAFQSVQPPLIPRRLFLDNPAKTDPQISPDGNYLSYLAPDRNDVLQIWLRSVRGGDDRQLTAEPKRGIRHYTWSYDTRHLLFARETDGDENWQIIALDMASGRMRNLTPYPGVRSLLVGMSPTKPETVLIAMNLRNRRLFDIYRIDIESGETRMVNRNGGAQLGWSADDRLNVRVAAAFAGTIVRERQGRPWKVARKWHPGEQSRYIGLSADGQTFFMSGSYNGEQSALLAVNLATGEETAIASDPQYDVEDALLEPISHKIQAVAFYKEKLEWQVLDQSVAEDFAALSNLRDAEMTVLHPPYESPIIYSSTLGRRDLSDRRWIVTYERDALPIEHYLYDRASKTATFLFSERPWLTDFTLAKMRAISYPSRDGLTIHGYLTLPEGSVQRNLPVVLYVHGGPRLRDRWGFHETVQWLANRGYAVLQVNYRGSTGYGRKFAHAGYKEWGGKMHDDLIDGVNWLVKEGIADPHRIAIMGGSYGGFAALAGLTLTPEVFVAGISNVGISNLLTHYETYAPYWFKALFRVRVGDPEKDADILKARSPLSNVERIKAPLLIAHGANDVRVNVHESEQMVSAMRAAGKPVEYLLYQDEGHRQWRPMNKIHFYAKVEEFLARYLGGRFEPVPDIPGEAGIAKRSK